MEVLAADDLERLRSLEPKGERGGVELYHGSIRDPVWEYVIDDRTAAVCLDEVFYDGEPQPCSAFLA